MYIYIFIYVYICIYIYVYVYIYTYIYVYICICICICMFIFIFIYIYISNFFKYTHIVRCLVSVFEAQPTIPRYSEEKCQPCFFCECVKTQDKWDICFLRYLNFMVHFVYFF